MKGGTPAIEAVAIVITVAVTGISWRRPPSLRMSRVPVSWSTMPALMKSAALKAQWLRMWNTPATAPASVPNPNSSVMSPRWLIVE